MSGNEFMLFNLYINHFLHREKNTMCVLHIPLCCRTFLNVYRHSSYVKSINVQACRPILRQGTDSEICCHKLQKCYRVIEKNKHETCFWFQKGRVIGNISFGGTEQAVGKERSTEIDRYYINKTTIYQF